MNMILHGASHNEQMFEEKEYFNHVDEIDANNECSEMPKDCMRKIIKKQSFNEKGNTIKSKQTEWYTKLKVIANAKQWKWKIKYEVGNIENVKIHHTFILNKKYNTWWCTCWKCDINFAFTMWEHQCLWYF